MRWAMQLVAVAAAAGQMKVIVDTDIGQDMDDSWALAFMVSRPDIFDIQLVLTSTRNTTGKAQIVAKMLAQANRTDIPIGIGPPSFQGTDLFWVGPAYPWAQDYELADYPGKVFDDGVAAAVDIIQRESQITVIELSPLTSMAALMQRFPQLNLGNTAMFAMAGSIRIGYLNQTGPSQEYNIVRDWQSAQVLFNGSPRFSTVEIAPLDTCGIVQLTGDNYKAVRTASIAGNVLATMLMDQFDVWCKTPQGPTVSSGAETCIQHSPSLQHYDPTTASTTLFDVQAAVAAAAAFGAVDPTTLFRTEQLRVQVDDQGYTKAGSDGLPVTAETYWAPGGLEVLETFIVTSLTGAPADLFV